MFLSNWAMTLATMYYIAVVLQKGSVRWTTFLLELSWVLQLFMPLLYWPFVYPMLPEDEKVNLLGDISQHGLLVPLLIFDHFCSKSIFIK